MIKWDNYVEQWAQLCWEALPEDQQSDWFEFLESDDVKGLLIDYTDRRDEVLEMFECAIEDSGDDTIHHVARWEEYYVFLPTKILAKTPVDMYTKFTNWRESANSEV